MRAGLLTETLEFQELQQIKSTTGSVKKEYVKILEARASRRKLTAVVDGDGVNASEQFIGNMIVFQVRYNPLIKENQLVVYQGVKYSIQLLDRKLDNTYIITLKKKND